MPYRPTILASKRLKPTKNTSHRGFTLAELLVSVMILGVLATFTIPKVLSAQQNSQRLAIFKETVGTYSDVLYTGYLQGRVRPGVSLAAYIQSNTNAIRICNSNATTQGCWQAGTIPGWGGWLENRPGMILHNGARVLVDDSTDDGQTVILVDWNGQAGPNLLGNDWLLLNTEYSSTPYCPDVRAGQMKGNSPTCNDPAEIALFNSLFN